MSNPDAFLNSQAPLPDLPEVPEEPLVPEEEETAEARSEADARADEHEPGAANVATAADSDAGARVREHLEAREGEDSGELLYVGDTPAGGGGADSGGGGTVRVDPASEASVPDESAHNDTPGIGTRRSRRNRD